MDDVDTEPEEDVERVGQNWNNQHSTKNHTHWSLKAI